MEMYAFSLGMMKARAIQYTIYSLMGDCKISITYIQYFTLYYTEPCVI